VRVTGVPVGYVPTYDLDGIGSPNEAAVGVTAGQERRDVDFGYRPGGVATIEGTVFNDVGKSGVFNRDLDPGIANVPLRLFVDSNGNGRWDPGSDLQIAQTVSDPDGNYGFFNIPTGLTYFVEVDQTAPHIVTELGGGPVRLTTQNPLVVTSLGGSRKGADFGFWREQPGMIGGSVFIDENGNGVMDAFERPVMGLPIKIYLDVNGDGRVDNSEFLFSVTTDAQGQYRATDMGSGVYLVKVDSSSPFMPQGYHQMIDVHSLSLEPGESNLTANFFFARLLSKTADRDSAVQGDQIVYNHAPNYPTVERLINLTITDAIPAGTSFAGAG